MFREMRFTKRQVPTNKAEEILKSQTYGILSVSGDAGYPYGVPLNYGYTDGKIYIHCTSSDSHKLDGIRRNPKVCFTVVSKHNLIEEELTTDFVSVIVFGIARILTDTAQKADAMDKMMHGLAPSYAAAARTHCSGPDCYVMLEITPEHITGKSAR